MKPPFGTRLRIVVRCTSLCAALKKFTAINSITFKSGVSPLLGLLLSVLKAILSTACCVYETFTVVITPMSVVRKPEVAFGGTKEVPPMLDLRQHHVRCS